LVKCTHLVDTDVILYYHLNMSHTRAQLITALSNEYAYLCAESPDDDDMTRTEYLDFLHDLTDAQLVTESCADDIDEYISLYS
jgi:hypothetical protein